MAQASSVQREPSMEEILASIRRIIEDNDTGRRPPIDFEHMRPEFDEVRAERNVIEVDAFKAEFQPASAPEKPVTLTEVKATVVPEPINKTEAPILGEKVAQKWTASEALKPVEIKPVIAPEFAPVVARAAPTPSWTPPARASIEPFKDVTASLAKADSAEDKPTVAPKPVEDTADKLTTPRSAIISEQAGRQVAASFGELNDAFAARSKKSFDEIAEEMLRPMLQDWLDNNLPVLVERLVREEIERVARGA